MSGGFVAYDKSGRIKLKGSYQNEEQVDLAFMIAATVVGVSSLEISSVTPRDLKEIKMTNSYVPQQSSSNAKGDKYALLIGVSEFKFSKKRYSDGITGIITAIKDVESIKKLLIHNGFKEKNIIVLTDEQATKSNIINEIHNLTNKVNPNDSVVFYISTHGTPPNAYGKMGIIPYDMKPIFNTADFKKVDAEKGNVKNIDKMSDDEIISIAKHRLQALNQSVSFDDMQNFITGIKTDKFVAIIDTCFSGAALQSISYPIAGGQYAEREKNYAQSLSYENKSELLGSGKICKISDYKNDIANSPIQKQCKNIVGSKSLYLTSETNSISNVTESVSPFQRGVDYEYEILEKFRNIFGSQASSYKEGKIIITATSGNEESLFDETGKIPNSYFTYYLLKGLNRSRGQLFPAFDYAQIRTRKLVGENYNCRTQTPEMISMPENCVNIDLSK